MSTTPRHAPHRTIVTSFSPSISGTNEYDDGVYILCMASPQEQPSSLSCALSDKSILTYDRHTLKVMNSIPNAHSLPITDITYVNNNSENGNIIGSTSQDGFLRIFDIRTNSNNAVMELSCPNKKKEELSSLSIGFGGTLAAAGGGKGNIHFFDLRTTSGHLGSYVDAHTDEVTKVRFQSSTNSGLLASASEDGLMCIHDTGQSTEEKALKSVMNTQTSIRDIGFFGPSGEGLYCLTGSESMSCWHHDSAQQLCDFGLDMRTHLTNAAGFDVDYLVGCQWDGTALHLVSGNSGGGVAVFRVDAGSIVMERGFCGGHKGCVRAFDWSGCNDASVVITGGEDARLCEWRLDQTVAAAGNNGAQPSQQGVVLGEGAASSRAGGARSRRQKKKSSSTPY